MLPADPSPSHMAAAVQSVLLSNPRPTTIPSSIPMMNVAECHRAEVVEDVDPANTDRPVVLHPLQVP